MSKATGVSNKDALNQFLAQNAANHGATGPVSVFTASQAGSVIKKPTVEGLQGFKSTKKAGQKETAKKEDRYDNDETRSVKHEIDYAKKGETRQILKDGIKQNVEKKQRLRERILRNLEGVRTGQAILKSEVGSTRSYQTNKSFFSTATARLAAQNKKAVNNFLDQIEEEDPSAPKCESCSAAVRDEQDLDLCDRIASTMKDEAGLRFAYDEFRRSKDLPSIDYASLNAANQIVNFTFCLACLLQCFKADQFDASTPFEGGMFKGLGINDHACQTYGDEDLKMNTKRKFDKTQHCLSKGFKDLNVPASSKKGLSPVTINAAHNDTSHMFKTQVIDFNAGLSDTILKPNEGGAFSARKPMHGNEDFAAGSRIPRAFKLTLTDKMPEWVQKMRDEGMSDDQIKTAINSKQQAYIDKWGNKSRVGILLGDYNDEIVQKTKLQVKSPGPISKTPRYTHGRNGSLPNIPNSQGNASRKVPMFPASTHKRAGSIKKNGAVMPSQNQAANSHHELHEGQFLTTNISFHEAKDLQDFRPYKRNFKKKTPFTQWSNAYFSGGVFFNPPVNGI